MAVAPLRKGLGNISPSKHLPGPPVGPGFALGTACAAHCSFNVPSLLLLWLCRPSFSCLQSNIVITDRRVLLLWRRWVCGMCAESLEEAYNLSDLQVRGLLNLLHTSIAFAHWEMALCALCAAHTATGGSLVLLLLLLPPSGPCKRTFVAGAAPKASPPATCGLHACRAALPRHCGGHSCCCRCILTPFELAARCRP